VGCETLSLHIVYDLHVYERRKNILDAKLLCPLFM